MVALVQDWTLILLGPTSRDEDDQGDDPDGQGKTDLDPADALEDLVEVGHQLHLEHEVVRDPGLVLKPHDGEVGLRNVFQDGQSGNLLDLDIELEPGTDIQRDAGPWFNPEDCRVETFVGRHSGLDLVKVELVRQVEMRQRDEDGRTEPAGRYIEHAGGKVCGVEALVGRVHRGVGEEVLVGPELVAADALGVDPRLGEVKLERSAQVVGVHLNESLLESRRVKLACPTLNLSARTGPVQGVGVIPSMNLKNH